MRAARARPISKSEIDPVDGRSTADVDRSSIGSPFADRSITQVR
jgi:hypothetical protein